MGPLSGDADGDLWWLLDPGPLLGFSDPSTSDEPHTGEGEPGLISSVIGTVRVLRHPSEVGCHAQRRIIPIEPCLRHRCRILQHAVHKTGHEKGMKFY